MDNNVKFWDLCNIERSLGDNLNESINNIMAVLQVKKYLNGKTFSLFPFGCKKVCVSYSGVKYMLNHQFIFSETSSLGLSNIFSSDESEIYIHDGDALLIINSKI